MKKTILIVDDEIGALTLIGVLLERGGFAILKAKGALAALQILTQAIPDLMIIDIMMPGMDGIELCRRIRQVKHLYRIPILILSTRGDAESVMQVMEAGATDYLPKPIIHHDIAAKVRSMLNRGND
jgi:DNA-binding response OmpR family regulator